MSHRHAGAQSYMILCSVPSSLCDPSSHLHTQRNNESAHPCATHPPRVAATASFDAQTGRFRNYHHICREEREQTYICQERQLCQIRTLAATRRARHIRNMQHKCTAEHKYKQCIAYPAPLSANLTLTEPLYKRELRHFPMKTDFGFRTKLAIR